MTPAIKIQGLIKHFGKVKALDGIDLQVDPGMIYGLLGPNGAGKTTTIRVMATLIRPDAGEVRVLGHDVVREAAAVRAQISLTGQYGSLDDDLTGLENLVLVGRLFGLSWKDARKRAEELVELFGLAEFGKAQLSTYSGGMRRRIDIAAGLAVPPRLLFLDEPTTGLDPRSRQQVWEMVRRIADNGATVLLTTQHLEEADNLARRLAVIDHGRVIAEGTPRELKAKVGGQSLHVHLADAQHIARASSVVGEKPGAAAPEVTEDALIFHGVNTQQAADLLSRLAAADIPVTWFSLKEPSLEEVFFALTGQPIAATKEEAA